MGSPERRERDRLELRGRILDAAREMFVAEGYEAVTMRRIADRIEYSAAAIYFHFQDKSTLMRELVANDLQPLTAELERIGRIPDPVERIREFGYAYINFARAYPMHYRFIFMSEWPPMLLDPYPPMTHEGQDGGYITVRSAVVAAIESKRLRPELADPDLLVQTIWAGWHGVASLQIARGHVKTIPWRPAKDVAHLMIDTLLHGLMNTRGMSRRSTSEPRQAVETTNAASIIP